MTPYICLWHSNSSHTSQHWKAWEGPCAGYTDVCVFSKQTLKNPHKNVFNAGLVKSHSAYLICFLKWLGLEEWRRIRTHRHRLNCRLICKWSLLTASCLMHSTTTQAKVFIGISSSLSPVCYTINSVIITGIQFSANHDEAECFCTVCRNHMMRCHIKPIWFWGFFTLIIPIHFIIH